MKDTLITSTTFTRTIVLNGDDIIKLAIGLDRADMALVEPAIVTFAIPTGGDYSGQVMEIDENHPVTVTLRYVKTQP